MTRLRDTGAAWIFPQAKNGDGSLRLRIHEAERQGWLVQERSGLCRVAES